MQFESTDVFGSLDKMDKTKYRSCFLKELKALSDAGGLCDAGGLVEKHVRTGRNLTALFRGRAEGAWATTAHDGLREFDGILPAALTPAAFGASTAVVKDEDGEI